MKRFIVISMLAAIVAHAFGCAIPGTHNYYLFSVVAPASLNDSIAQRLDDNWKTYSDGQVDGYDADRLRSVARKKNDQLMLGYIDQLEKYLEVARKAESDAWDYPSKRELARRQKVLQGVRQYALSKTKSRLRSQHALLYMRCNMRLGLHAANVAFWEQTAQGFIRSVYRDMMRNIYAGALLKAGRDDEATQIFVEQGDVQSLYTYYYKKRSFESIQAEYEHNPNSPALPFLLQDFANNAQEAIDTQDDSDINFPGKLFIRDIEKAEAMKMCALADRVCSEGKSSNPALWKSAEAWLQFLFGDRRKAHKSIEQAMEMEGLPRIKDNARVLRLFIAASTETDIDRLGRMLPAELSWLEEKADEERGQDTFYYNHYTQVFDRLVHQALVPRYDKADRHDQATAFLCAYDEMRKMFYRKQEKRTSRIAYGWNPDYGDESFHRIDTIPVEQLETYFTFTQQKPKTALDQWLSAHIYHDAEFLHEVLGTKYLRLARWAEAERHLAKVSVDFVNAMNIAPFMAQRSYKVEPWLKRQRIKESMQMPGAAKTKTSQKLDFVREMAALEQGFGAMEPDAKAMRAYDLAVRYAQASYAGDAWYLTRYGKSCYDDPRPDETDMVEKAAGLLQTAYALARFDMREKVLFAQAYLPRDHWFTEEWDDKKGDFVVVLQPESKQFKALKALADFERQHASQTSQYVSRCDVLKKFIRQNQ